MVARTNRTARSADVLPGPIALVARPGSSHTGVGRYSQMLEGGLLAAGVQAIRIAPGGPALPAGMVRLARAAGADLSSFFATYPLWLRETGAAIAHLTSQNLASLLLLRRPRGRVVVTVHDIIPHMLRKHPTLGGQRSVADRLFDRMAMIGLRRADVLLADSHYSARCVVEQLGIAAARIRVIYLGIDHARFRPQPESTAIRARYRLPPDRRYLLYVGSEDPRKNLAPLLHALAELRREHPEVELIKVGRAHFEPERQRLLQLADDLGIRPAIHLLDDLPEHDLPSIYSLAEIYVMPSLYEGFGLPVLEAMACGTPVVCAAATSLPELVQDAGLLVEMAGDGRGPLQQALEHMLAHPASAATLRARGLARAAHFSWERTIEHVIQSYRQPEL